MVTGWLSKPLKEDHAPLYNGQKAVPYGGPFGSKIRVFSQLFNTCSGNTPVYSLCIACVTRLTYILCIVNHLCWKMFCSSFNTTSKSALRWDGLVVACECLLSYLFALNKAHAGKLSFLLSASWACCLSVCCLSACCLSTKVVRRPLFLTQMALHSFPMVSVLWRFHCSNDCFKIMRDLYLSNYLLIFWVWLSVLGMGCGGYFWLGTRKLHSWPIVDVTSCA